MPTPNPAPSCRLEDNAGSRMPSALKPGTAASACAAASALSSIGDAATSMTYAIAAAAKACRATVAAAAVALVLSSLWVTAVEARCPVAQDLTFIPAQPVASEAVTIRLRVYLSVFLNFQGQRSGDLIQLQAYTTSMSGALPPAQDLDWFAGILPPGTYRVRLNTQWGNMIPPTICPTVETELVVAGTPVPPTPARPAPALSAWALGLVAAVLALLGGLAARRRGL